MCRSSSSDGQEGVDPPETWRSSLPDLLRDVAERARGWRGLATWKRAGMAAGSLVALGATVDIVRFLSSVPPGGGNGLLGFGGGGGGDGLDALAALYTNDLDSDSDEETDSDCDSESQVSGRRDRRSRRSGASGSSRFVGSGAEPTVVYDVQGRVIATLMLSPSGSQTLVREEGGGSRLLPRGCVFGVPLSETSDSVWQAIVASEDKRFFDHNGIDFFGIARAVLSLGGRGGGSTITQQLAKNVALNPSRTVTRKVVELFLALGIERKMRKRSILEAYLNTVYWGHGVWGVAGASAVYFRKKPRDLNLEEASLLAGILPAPEHLSPYRNPKGCLRARASVLRRMLACGYITDGEFDQVASKKQLPRSMLTQGGGLLDGGRETQGGGGPAAIGVPFRAPYFVAEVLYQLRGLFTDGEVLHRGGLQVHTTVDLALQEHAERILQEDGARMRLGEDKGEAALVAMDPHSGAVRVLVGGRSYAKSPYNRAMLALRQPGSAFKPIVYLAALATGLVTPRTEVEDEEIVFRREGDQEGGWTAISKKDRALRVLERREEREKEREEAGRRAQRLRMDHERTLRSHREAAERCRRRLQATQRRIAEYEGGKIVRKQSYFDSLLEESSLLEEELLRLEESVPTPSPEIPQLERRSMVRTPAPAEAQASRRSRILGRPAPRPHSSSSAEEEEEDEEVSDREGDYCPQNYSREYRGVVTLRQSLAGSLNVPTVKLANLIGVDAVIDMARKLGIRGKLPYELSLALGSCEVTPFEMAHAFNTIASGGVCSRPHLITKVRDSANRVVYRHKASKRVVLGRNICADMHRMLCSAVTEGTGRAATKGWPAGAAAGKTGTSDDYRDAWFAGEFTGPAGPQHLVTDERGPNGWLTRSVCASLYLSLSPCRRVRPSADVRGLGGQGRQLEPPRHRCDPRRSGVGILHARGPGRWDPDGERNVETKGEGQVARPRQRGGLGKRISS